MEGIQQDDAILAESFERKTEMTELEVAVSNLLDVMQSIIGDHKNSDENIRKDLQVIEAGLLNVQRKVGTNKKLAFEAYLEERNRDR